MARFSGKVGFGSRVESSPGVWVDEITERLYFGDVNRADRMLTQGENVNPDLRVNNEISIVADAYGSAHIFAIRYVEWEGVRWTVSHVEVRPPRLILQLGEFYNGPIPA
jgi:hypothetical protein